MRHFIVLTLALSLLTTAGCKKTASLANRNDPSATASAAVDSESTDAGKKKHRKLKGSDDGDKKEEDEEDALGTKLEPYIDCINKMSGNSSRMAGSVQAAEQRYLHWVDAKKGPTGKESHIDIYPLDDPSKCLEGLTKAKTLKPALPVLEGEGDAYAAALTKIAPLIKDAHEYYDQGNYKDDKYAKAKQMHPGLMAAFDEFDKADTAMRGEVDKTNRQLKERELAELEKTEGRKIPYFHTDLMLLAEDIVNMANVDDDFSKIDATKFAAKVEEFEKIYKEAGAYAAAHKEEADKLHEDWLTRDYGEANDFLKTAKDTMRRLRDKKPFNSSELDWLKRGNGDMVDGSSEKVLKAYNTLVDRSNRKF